MNKDMAKNTSNQQKGEEQDPNRPVLHRMVELARTHEFMLTIETDEQEEVISKMTHLAATDEMKTLNSAHWFNKRPEIVVASTIDQMRAIRLLPKEKVKGKGGNVTVLHKFTEIVEGNGDYDPGKKYVTIPFGNPIDLPHPNDVNDSTPA